MLVEQKMIDKLIVKRRELVEVYVTMLQAKRDAMALVVQMQGIIPLGSAMCFDDLTDMPIVINEAFGEKAGHRLSPRDHLLAGKTNEEIRESVTKVIDRRLWDSCYNRMNVYSLMTQEERVAFAKQDCKDVLEFTLENVGATLMNLFNNRHDMMVSKLMKVVISAERSGYKSNEGFKFGPRIVLENACHSLKLSANVITPMSDLYAVLTSLESVVNGHKVYFEDGAFKHARLWNELLEDVTQQGVDIGQLEDVDLRAYGIKVRFFKKGTVHLILSSQLIVALNDLLAKTKSLAPEKRQDMRKAPR